MVMVHEGGDRDVLCLTGLASLYEALSEHVTIWVYALCANGGAPYVDISRHFLETFFCCIV